MRSGRSRYHRTVRERAAPGPYLWTGSCTAWSPPPTEPLVHRHLSLVPLSGSRKGLTFPALGPSSQPPPRIWAQEAPGILSPIQNWQIRNAPFVFQGQNHTHQGWAVPPLGGILQKCSQKYRTTQVQGGLAQQCCGH